MTASVLVMIVAVSCSFLKSETIPEEFLDFCLEGGPAEEQRFIGHKMTVTGQVFEVYKEERELCSTNGCVTAPPYFWMTWLSGEGRGGFSLKGTMAGLNSLDIARLDKDRRATVACVVQKTIPDRRTLILENCAVRD